MVKKQSILKVLSKKGMALALAGMMTVGTGAVLTMPGVSDDFSITANAAMLYSKRYSQLACTRDNAKEIKLSEIVNLSDGSYGKINSVKVSKGSGYIDCEVTNYGSADGSSMGKVKVWGVKTYDKECAIKITTTGPVNEYTVYFDRVIPVTTSGSNKPYPTENGTATSEDKWKKDTDGAFYKSSTELKGKTVVNLPEYFDIASTTCPSCITVSAGTNSNQVVLQPKSNSGSAQTVTIEGETNTYKIKFNKVTVSSSSTAIEVQTGKSVTKTFSKSIKSFAITNSAYTSNITLSKNDKVLTIKGVKYTSAEIPISVTFEDNSTQTYKVKMKAAAASYNQYIEAHTSCEVKNDVMKDENFKYKVSTINGVDVSYFVSVTHTKGSNVLKITGNKSTLDLKKLVGNTTQKNVTVIGTIGSMEVVKVNVWIIDEVNESIEMPNQSSKVITTESDAPLTGYKIKSVKSENTSRVTATKNSDDKATLKAIVGDNNKPTADVVVTWKHSSNNTKDHPNIDVRYHIALTQKLTDYSSDSTKDKVVGEGVSKKIQLDVKSGSNYRKLSSVTISNQKPKDTTKPDATVATADINDDCTSFTLKGITQGTAILDVTYSTGTFRYKVIVDNSTHIKNVYPTTALKVNEKKQYNIIPSTASDSVKTALSGRTIASVKTISAKYNNKSVSTDAVTTRIVSYTKTNTDGTKTTVDKKRFEVTGNNVCTATVRVTYDNGQYSDFTVNVTKNAVIEKTMTMNGNESKTVTLKDTDGSYYDNIAVTSNSSYITATPKTTTQTVTENGKKVTITTYTGFTVKCSDITSEKTAKITAVCTHDNIVTTYVYTVTAKPVLATKVNKTLSLKVNASKTVYATNDDGDRVATISNLKVSDGNKVSATTNNTNAVTIKGLAQTAANTPVKVTFTGTDADGKKYDYTYSVTVTAADSTESTKTETKTVKVNSTTRLDLSSYGYDYITSITGTGLGTYCSTSTDYQNYVDIKGLKTGTATLKFTATKGSNTIVWTVNVTIQPADSATDTETKNVSVAIGKTADVSLIGYEYLSSTSCTGKYATASTNYVDKVTVKGQAAGTETVTLTGSKNGKTVKITIKVTVLADTVPTRKYTINIAKETKSYAVYADSATKTYYASLGTPVSSNQAVATATCSANKTIKVTGKAAGTAVITVDAKTTDGIAYKIQYTVNVSDATTKKFSLTLDKGVTKSYSMASYISNVTSSKSSNTAVATVKTSGTSLKITTIAAGTTTITVNGTDASGNKYILTYNVTVNNAITRKYTVNCSVNDVKTYGVYLDSTAKTYFTTLDKDATSSDSTVATATTTDNKKITIKALKEGQSIIKINATDSNGTKYVIQYTVNVS